MDGKKRENIIAQMQLESVWVTNVQYKRSTFLHLVAQGNCLTIGCSNAYMRVCGGTFNTKGKIDLYFDLKRIWCRLQIRLM